MLNEYAVNMPDFTAEESRIWERLRVRNHENALDKQIAATALIYDLTLVTPSVGDFMATGEKLLKPFP